MANWSDDQLSAAAEFMQANINNPDAIAQRRDELGLTNQDLLQAAQTVNQGLTLGGVQQFLGETPKAAPVQQPQQYQPNPYLDQMAAGITQQATRNLNEQIMPGIRSQAIAAGGFGDARHGVAEGLAIGRTNDALTNALANLYGTDYQKSMDRNASMAQAEMQNKLGYAGLDTQRYGIDQNTGTQRYGMDLSNGTQRYGIDQQYALGQTNATNNRYATDKGYDVGMANANASMANAAANQANAAGQLSLGQQRLGMEGLWGVLDRQFQYGQAGQNSAGTIQNTPLNYTQQVGQTANSIAGRGGSTSATTQSPSNPYATALGAGQLVSSWWNGQNQPQVVDGGYSQGQGSSYQGTTDGGVFTPYRAGM